MELISENMLDILIALESRGGFVDLHELFKTLPAHAMGRRSFYNLIARLEGRGLIAAEFRGISNHDMRYKFVAIADAGSSLLDKCRKKLSVYHTAIGVPDDRTLGDPEVLGEEIYDILTNELADIESLEDIPRIAERLPKKIARIVAKYL